MIELRVLTPDDWVRWRELRLVALADAPYAFASALADWQGDGDREERWRARLSIPDSYHVLAELGGRPVGMVSGVLEPRDGAVDLISLWVAEEARGQGVGDHLVRAVVHWAVRRGAEVVRLAVTPGNVHAVALYRRHGFGDTGQLGDQMPDGQQERLLVKRLHAG
ncbi:GNAT family N-acetyltransferase [Streptomyces sp. NPDC006314]|uniref:GNAT family N-acetyltransferase n=1 Tax=Streptomyces sp. NPDC006314 TaxID=3154475 RepID=UPI0033AB7C07